MSHDPAGEPEPIGDALSRTREHGARLAGRIASLAASIAESEEDVARTYEDSARLRPHAAERLQRAADEARRFAHRRARPGGAAAAGRPGGRARRGGLRSPQSLVSTFWSMIVWRSGVIQRITRSDLIASGG